MKTNLQTIVNELTKFKNSWYYEMMEEHPEEQMGVMIHFNKEQFDELLTILSK